MVDGNWTQHKHDNTKPEFQHTQDFQDGYLWKKDLDYFSHTPAAMNPAKLLPILLLLSQIPLAGEHDSNDFVLCLGLCNIVVFSCIHYSPHMQLCCWSGWGVRRGGSSQPSFLATGVSWQSVWRAPAAYNYDRPLSNHTLGFCWISPKNESQWNFHPRSCILTITIYCDQWASWQCSLLHLGPKSFPLIAKLVEHIAQKIDERMGIWGT